MSGERHLRVAPEDDGQRLDRWLKKCVPALPYALAQKLIRKGAIRVDGKRGKTDTRLSAGQEIRLPPLEDRPDREKPARRPSGPEDEAFIRSLVLYDDGDLVVFDKPAGLASQGGGGVEWHIDFYFPLLEKNGLPPHLIHRLDRDTSGLLLAARAPDTVRRLGRMFRDRRVRKTYWAITAGVPNVPDGTVKAPLAKTAGPIKDKMVIDEANGKYAETDFAVIDRIGRDAAFIAFRPRTGRTHQIRVHAANALHCPVLGDGKYGGKSEALDALDIAPRLHLHARFLAFDGHNFTAPLPPDLKASWIALGFDPAFKGDPFEE